MFFRGYTLTALACIALIFCSGTGVVVAFIVGWVKSAEWMLRPVLWTWTVFFWLNLLIALPGH
jgi:hypothetical protein